MPVVWGTYAPVVRYVYERPVPPPGILFSAAYYVVALSTLLAVKAALRPTSTSSVSERAGAELGAYLFLGNVAQVLGLQTTSADAAAFLVQLTTIFVPALEAATTQGSLPARTRNACGLAFLGVAVICGGDVGDSFSATGDALVVLAAIFYSFHVLRLGEFAPRVDAVDLAVSKAKYETLFAVATVVAAVVFTPARDMWAFFQAADRGDQTTLILATVWCGAMTCAYTIWAQSYGQRDVTPARANLIYTSQPIFSSFFAAVLVGENPTPASIVGGALILFAVYTEIFGGERADDTEVETKTAETTSSRR